MNKNELKRVITEKFEEVFRTQNPGESIPVLDESTVLLDTGLDSLGFAILVTVLDAELDYDPFSLSEDAFYPQTFGEFVDFYADNYPK